MTEPFVQVGIMSATQIDFDLSPHYIYKEEACTGKSSATYSEGKIRWRQQLYDELVFESVDGDSASFTLFNVVIGKQFHWQRVEDQKFRGNLKFIVEGDQITAVNVVPVEKYLESVVSSEMNATASPALLQAHAVISRSWLFHQMQSKTKENSCDRFVDTDESLIRWQDREDHLHFDVCADDHCQRYQGITRISSPKAIEAVCSTRGQVLTSEGELCDARFSKCCGGAMEQFSTCWEDKDYTYLRPLRDNGDVDNLPDLTDEAEAKKWILSSPDAFCNTTDKQVLSQVLNDYDQETHHFYRWQVSYSQTQLSQLVARRSGIDYGLIQDLVPIERGPSGRIKQLKIIGSLRTRIIGKELEIRHTLSESHLYSSAFVVDKGLDDNGEIRFVLHGAGWGHGVGLCQIGAAVMGVKGYTYADILNHYYPGSEITQMYK